MFIKQQDDYITRLERSNNLPTCRFLEIGFKNEFIKLIYIKNSSGQVWLEYNQIGKIFLHHREPELETFSKLANSRPSIAGSTRFILRENFINSVWVEGENLKIFNKLSLLYCTCFFLLFHNFIF